MKRLARAGVLATLWLVTVSLFAEPQATEVELIDVPDPVVSGEILEPEINIIRRDDATITEYRINGRLYKAKIIPSVGSPYYLVDRDGDGNLESRVNDIYQDIAVPQWVLLSW